MAPTLLLAEIEKKHKSKKLKISEGKIWPNLEFLRSTSDPDHSTLVKKLEKKIFLRGHFQKVSGAPQGALWGGGSRNLEISIDLNARYKFYRRLFRFEFSLGGLTYENFGKFQFFAFLTMTFDPWTFLSPIQSCPSGGPLCTYEVSSRSVDNS